MQYLNTITCEEFQLVDKNGKIRVRLGFHSDDPCLQFFDSNGSERIKIGMTSDEPSISIYNSDASTMVAIGCVCSDSSGIKICDDKGNLGITMLVNPHNGSEIDIYDAMGESLWEAP